MRSTPIRGSAINAPVRLLPRVGGRGGATLYQGTNRLHLTTPEMRALADALHDECDYQDERQGHRVVPAGTTSKQYLGKQREHLHTQIQ